MKIRTRLFLIFMLIAGSGLVMLLVWVERTGLPLYLASLEDDLVEKAAIFTTYLEGESVGNTPNLEAFGGFLYEVQKRPLEASIYGREKSRSEFDVTVTNREGRVIFDSNQGLTVGQDFSRWNDIARTLRGNYGARATWTGSPNEKVLTLYVALPIVLNGQLAGALAVSKETRVAYAFQPRARREVILNALLILLFIATAGFAITFWVSKPIMRVTQYAQAIAKGEQVACPDFGNSDMGQMARSLESMRRALDGKGYVEEYVQTLTHEIKSPLSAIKGAAELIDEHMPIEKRARFLTHIRQETERIQQLIDRLLELSSLESRDGLHDASRVDLGKLTRHILEEAKPSLAAKNLEVRFPETKGLIVLGEAFLLRLAISNLIQNAIAFAPEGGWISVEFGRRSIRITDNGPGVADFAKTKVFQRFFSLPNHETGRKSSGLGLSIVQQIAKLHQGGVQLQNAADAGAQVVLWFPLEALTEGSKDDR